MLYRLSLLFFALPALGRDGDIVLTDLGKVIGLEPVRQLRQP